MVSTVQCTISNCEDNKIEALVETKSDYDETRNAAMGIEHIVDWYTIKPMADEIVGKNYISERQLDKPPTEDQSKNINTGRKQIKWSNEGLL